MEAAIRKGRQLPQWYLEEPHLPEDGPFYFRSFWDLSSTRRFAGGPIPWGDIVGYGKHHGLDEDLLDPFVAIIRALDAAYMEWASPEPDKSGTKPHNKK